MMLTLLRACFASLVLGQEVRTSTRQISALPCPGNRLNHRQFQQSDKHDSPGTTLGEKVRPTQFMFSNGSRIACNGSTVVA